MIPGKAFMIRALVFDFDGLIVDTETPIIDAYAEVFAAYGHPFDRDLLARNTGHSDYAFDPWQAFGPTADREALESERRQRNRERDRVQPVLPGVVSLLDQAAAAGVRVGLASNSTHEHVERHLRRIGLLERFEFLACRGDAPSPKPEPDLYRLVLAHFGLRGFEAVALEDSGPGTLAAKRAGLWVVAIPNGSTVLHDFAHVDLRVNSMADCSLTALRKRFENQK